MSEDTATLHQAFAERLEQARQLERTGHWSEAIDLRSAVVAGVANAPVTVPRPRPANPDNDLERLGDKHRPSKRGHDYLARYWTHLRDLRSSAKQVVEIGVQTSRSVDTWEEFFPNATIHGIDIDPRCRRFAGGRKQIWIGDQTDEAFLLDFIAATGGEFDVVIDDGLHTGYSMLKSFSYLYPALSDHGVYVIEDIQREPEILKFLHYLMTCINYVPDGFPMTDWPRLSRFSDDTPWLIRNTVGVSFYRYLAFIERGFNPRDNRFLVSDEEFYARREQRRDVVRAAIRGAREAGAPISRERLVDELGANFAHHIDFVLTEDE